MNSKAFYDKECEIHHAVNQLKIVESYLHRRHGDYAMTLRITTNLLKDYLTLMATIDELVSAVADYQTAVDAKVLADKTKSDADDQTIAKDGAELTAKEATIAADQATITADQAVIDAANATIATLKNEQIPASLVQKVKDATAALAVVGTTPPVVVPVETTPPAVEPAPVVTPAAIVAPEPTAVVTSATTSQPTAETIAQAQVSPVVGNGS